PYVLYLFLLLIIVYFSQGVFYPQGSPISQGSLAMLLSISLFYFLKTLAMRDKKPLVFNVWTVFFIINFFIYLFFSDTSTDYPFRKFKNLIIICLPFYPVYYFSKTGLLKAKTLQLLFLIVLPIAIFQ